VTQCRGDNAGETAISDQVYNLQSKVVKIYSVSVTVTS